MKNLDKVRGGGILKEERDAIFMKIKYLVFGIFISLLLCGCSTGSSENSESSSSVSPSSPSDNGSSSTHTHTFDVTTWEHDETYHWHKSTCGHDAVDAKAEHSYKDVVIPATEKEGGYTSHACVVCDYSYNTDQTPNLVRQRALGMIPVLDDAQQYLTYGLYPQTHVSVETTVNALNELSKEKSTEINGWYLYNDEYYAQKTTNTYDSGCTFNDGTTIEPDTSYWYKCELIEWKILALNDGAYSLVSTVLLDAHKYNESYTGTKNDYYANNYDNSEIRSWLNDDFLNTAFNLKSSHIQTMIVDNSGSTTDSSSNRYASANTKDKVYLLSYRDYLNAGYGFSISSSSSTTRYCKATDYARANGSYNAGYWTRSPSSGSSSRAWYVSNDGSLNYYDYYVNYANIGVRPAITVNYPL